MSLIDQISNNGSEYHKLSRESLGKLIEDVLFKDKTRPKVWTGRGGVKGILKELSKDLFPNQPYSWKIMRACYRFLLRTGLKKIGGIYEL